MMSDYEQSVLVFAMRYALPRRTGASYVVAEQILSNWDKLSHQTQNQIINEILLDAIEPEAWLPVTRNINMDN